MVLYVVKIMALTFNVSTCFLPPPQLLLLFPLAQCLDTYCTTMWCVSVCMSVCGGGGVEWVGLHDLCIFVYMCVMCMSFE